MSSCGEARPLHAAVYEPCGEPYPLHAAVYEPCNEPYPLHAAVYEDDMEAAMSWLHRHPTHLHLLDSEGDSVMHVAVRRGNIAIVRLLLSVGFDINCRSADDWTVLEEAHACAPPQVLKAVYEAVQVDECRRWHGRSRQVVQGLRRMADFVIDVHWRLGMRVLGIGVGALLRRFLPSDTCTIRKRGARLRADAGLVGIDTSALAWRRGEVSLFLDLECPRPGEAAWSLPGAYTPCVDAAGEAAVEPPREIEIPREIVMADHQARTTPRPSANPNPNPHPNPSHNPNPNPSPKQARTTAEYLRTWAWLEPERRLGWAEVDELLALGLQRHSPSQAQPIEAEEGAHERGFGPVLGRDGEAARDPAHDLCGQPARRYRWRAPLGVHERSRTAQPWRVQMECTYAGHLVAKRRAEAAEAEATHRPEGGGAGAGDHWVGGFEGLGGGDGGGGVGGGGGRGLAGLTRAGGEAELSLVSGLLLDAEQLAEVQR